jgi:MoaA/NifB/PqqE/SkfB family radical SAM enzyme
MISLSGLHFLLTYQCNFECDHCFVWGSPSQTGTFFIQDIYNVLQQAKETGTIKEIYFEGGEPCLYYPILLQGIREAKELGFQVGVVTNSYWATSVNDAKEWLEPLVGLLDDLSVSTDLFHYDERISKQALYASDAAKNLGIPMGMISIEKVEDAIQCNQASFGQLPIGESKVMFRGRAVEKLLKYAALYPWEQFIECPHENLRDPGRVHVDPLGNLHICQGITIGNVFKTPLKKICVDYVPEKHPIIAPLLAGGPKELVDSFHLSHEDRYADACHLCYQARVMLRSESEEFLCPDQMYGIFPH